MRPFTTVDTLALIAVALVLFVLCLPLLHRCWTAGAPVFAMDEDAPLTEVVSGQAMTVNTGSELLPDSMSLSTLPLRDAQHAQPLHRVMNWQQGTPPRS